MHTGVLLIYAVFVAVSAASSCQPVINKWKMQMDIIALMEVDNAK